MENTFRHQENIISLMNNLLLSLDKPDIYSYFDIQHLMNCRKLLHYEIYN